MEFKLCVMEYTHKETGEVQYVPAIEVVVTDGEESNVVTFEANGSFDNKKKAASFLGCVLVGLTMKVTVDRMKVMIRREEDGKEADDTPATN